MSGPRADLERHLLRKGLGALTRDRGRGAGARFRFLAPFQRCDWADVTFIEVEPPRRIVQAGRGGKYNRTRLRSVWELEPGAAGTTRVSLMVETRPAMRSDRLMESFGLRGWLKRKSAKALRRVRSILEEGEGRGQRAPTAGLRRRQGRPDEG